MMKWERIDVKHLDELDPDKKYRLGPWLLSFTHQTKAWSAYNVGTQAFKFGQTEVQAAIEHGLAVYEGHEPLRFEGKGFVEESGYSACVRVPWLYGKWKNGREVRVTIEEIVE